MARMTYSEAMEIVHSLATQNRIDDNDIAFGDKALASERVWQAEAIDTMEDLVVNMGGDIDALVEAPDVPAAVAIEAVACHRSMDPSRPQASLRICLAAARNHPDAEVEGVDGEKNRAAIALVEDFVARHAGLLDERMTTIPLRAL